MKIKDFEKQIQKDIDKDLSIRVNPNAKDVAGVYWKDTYIYVALPSEEIREEYDPNYRDDMGHPYKNVSLAIDFINGKLAKYKQVEKDDPDLLK